MHLENDRRRREWERLPQSPENDVYFNGSFSLMNYMVGWPSERRFQGTRVVAAGMGDKGYWGDFVVEEDGRWNSYELTLTPILDAVFLSQGTWWHVA